jgi:putative transposase
MSVEIEQPTITIKCKYCQSEAILRYGTYKGVQRYWCKTCQRKFKADDTTFHMKTDASEVSAALSMWYEGMSIEAINRQLGQDYGRGHSSATIYEWLQKYTKYAVDSAKDYHPKVGDIWIADETYVRVDKLRPSDKTVKNPYNKSKAAKWLVCWDIIDADTRFLLATRLTTSRTKKDAQMLMDRAIAKASKSPRVVYTDALGSYLDINYGKDATHRVGGPFDIGNNTNLIERFHGTFKARTKVMRALKNLNTAHSFLEGWLVHYNYLRPHESLVGKTPAEAAGVAYPYKNWNELSRKHTLVKVVTPQLKVTVREVPTSFDIVQPNRKARITTEGKPLISRSRRGEFPLTPPQGRLS